MTGAFKRPHNFKIMIDGFPLLSYLVKEKNNRFKEFTFIKEDLLIVYKNREYVLNWLCYRKYINIINKYDFKREDFLRLNIYNQSPLYWLCYKGLKSIINRTPALQAPSTWGMSEAAKNVCDWLNNVDEAGDILSSFRKEMQSIQRMERIIGLVKKHVLCN